MAKEHMSTVENNKREGMPRPAFSLSRGNAAVAVLLTLVLLLGGYFRFVGLNWDDYTHLHPDERFLTQVLAGMGGPISVGGPANPELGQACQDRYPKSGGRGLYLNGGYFDAQCSALNPNNYGFGLYVYGTFPLFIADIASDRFADIAGWWDRQAAEVQGFAPAPPNNHDVWRGYNGGHLVWRGLNGISDLIAALVLFLVGRRLHNKWTGLLAATLYIAAPLPIQKAHFATVNSMANMFGVLAMYHAVRVQDRGRWWDYFAFGCAFAAALASRINLAPLVVLVLLASGLRMLPAFDWRLAWGERNRIVGREFGGLVLAGIVTIVGFRILQPYAFAGPGFFSVDFQELASGSHTLGIFNETWLENIGQAQFLVSGEAESPPNWQWVNRTGYIFPLTNMLLWGMGVALGLSAWLGLLWAGSRIVRGLPDATRNLLPVGWILVYFAWIGNLWVMSMRYYLPLYPGLILLGAWALVELARRGLAAEGRSPIWRFAGVGVLVTVLVATQIWGLMFTNIYRNQLTRVQATHWVWENIPGDFSMVVENAPPGTPLVNIALFNPFGEENQLTAQASVLEAGIEYVYDFTAPADGVIREVNIPHMSAMTLGATEEHRLRVNIRTADGNGLLSQGTLAGDFTRGDHPIGPSHTIALEAPVPVMAGTDYTFEARVETAGQLIIGGAVVSNEGAWDDPVPTIVCTMPDGITLVDNPPSGLNNAQDCNARNAYSGLVNGYAMGMALDDIELKRGTMQRALDHSDYIIISSNRFYDSVARNPERWPMTMAYYDALFNEELGYELAAFFVETFELGPLRVPDQHLPTMDAPGWLNEFEAEEAFHVYDHPAVFIFRKIDDYDPAVTERVLFSQPLNRVENVTIGLFNDPGLVGVLPTYSLPVDDAPTQLKLKPEFRDVQFENGTWSSLFNRDALLNQQPVVAVVVWWLLLMLFGWVAFPTVFAMFPALSDRGYAVSKFAGLMLVAWFAWFATSFQLHLWGAGGLWFSLGLLASLSGWLGWHNRAALNTFVRQNWTKFALLEGITLLAFLFFLGVRLSNPDLWHPAFGGEKPMDFAYFNAVLRSTTFPPLDPWHAGGYINYYYFGFVLTGVPVLMLQMVPSIAYNLIIPTLFALTGIGAFTVAFNIVGGINRRNAEADAADGPRAGAVRRVTGSPWTAGITALLLAVVLGNLNTPRVFTNGLARVGGFTQAATINEFMIDRYTQQHGVEPTGEALLTLMEQAGDPSATDRLLFNLDRSWNGFSAVMQGAWAVAFEGAALNVPTNRWYWASTRILAEPPVSSGNAITEMPYFTFLYGDLHAHMISMPMQLLVLLFLIHEVLHAGHPGRRRLSTVLAVGLGAGTVGMLRATNTWDWPTYMLLGVLGIGFAWWLKWRSFGRPAIVDMFLRVGGFIALSIWLSWPYTRWYAAIYSSASLWEGVKTPIWAYLTIHGLFMFLIVSLLVWDTGRWLRETKVRTLRGQLLWLYVGLAVLVLVAVAGLGLSVAGWPVSLFLVPMLAWAIALFFRSGQSREMQFTLTLIALAIGVTLGVEYIVIDGDIGRQNTVFKFYLQGWLMFAVIGGVAVAWMLDSTYDWPLPLNLSWLLTLATLFTVAALYPLMATQARAVDRMVPSLGPVLDGMAFMQQAQHYEVVDTPAGRGEVLDLEYDYNVIRWLQDNVEGTPIIMEGQSEAEYRWGGRISIYTGLPSVIGWNWHQRQQRTLGSLPMLVQQRVANVNAFYSTTDPQIAANILQHYEVEYVIVSALEQARFPDGINKFYDLADMGVLVPVYSEDNYAIVFEVNRVAAQQLALGQPITETNSEVARAE